MCIFGRLAERGTPSPESLAFTAPRRQRRRNMASATQKPGLCLSLLSLGLASAPCVAAPFWLTLQNAAGQAERNAAYKSVRKSAKRHPDRSHSHPGSSNQEVQGSLLILMRRLQVQCDGCSTWHAGGRSWAQAPALSSWATQQRR